MENNNPKKVLSEESEDYNIDDIMEIHKPDEDNNSEQSSLIKSYDINSNNPLDLNSLPLQKATNVIINKSMPATKPIISQIIPSVKENNSSIKENLSVKKANVSFEIDNDNLILEDKKYNLLNVEHVDTILKEISSILSSRISSSIIKFAQANKCEEDIKLLYNSLENLSKNRGSAKEIIEIGSKIQNAEDEKTDKNVTEEEIHNTVEDITLISSVLSKFQSILENRLFK